MMMTSQAELPQRCCVSNEVLCIPLRQTSLAHGGQRGVVSDVGDYAGVDRTGRQIDYRGP